MNHNNQDDSSDSLSDFEVEELELEALELAISFRRVEYYQHIEKMSCSTDRKVQVTQNIICACSFDMMFTFVFTGWEGTANDSRVFSDAIGRQENGFPHPNEDMNHI
ncbi:hypothetical protein Ddye_009316 [Dipteronia dyeriana]|uniref:DDE Tnp4 domain-containing protein n=1 Tax=Dipteronia dyeriana TaxID=168575 RepID=A0AAD9XBC1_9ROSI|nr:hypothetical protein Ddye_009316 [Dipteronia dyeriana]